MSQGGARRINTSFHLSLLLIEQRKQEDGRKLGHPFIQFLLGSIQGTDRVGKSCGRDRKQLDQELSHSQQLDLKSSASGKGSMDGKQQ